MTADEMAAMLNGLKLALPQWAPSEITRSLCLLWLDALRNFGDDNIRSAFRNAAENLERWPAPATIKRICQGHCQNDEEIGAEVSARISGAIEWCGLNQTMAKQLIGEIGWEVVDICGGWEHVCGYRKNEMGGLYRMESYNGAPERKLWRELAVQISKKLHQGERESINPPSFPKGNRPKPLHRGKIPPPIEAKS